MESLIRSKLLDEIRQSWEVTGVDCPTTFSIPFKYFHSTKLLGEYFGYSRHEVFKMFPSVRYSTRHTYSYCPDLPCENACEWIIGNMMPVSYIVQLCKMHQAQTDKLRKYCNLRHPKYIAKVKTSSQWVSDFVHCDLPFMRAIFCGTIETEMPFKVRKQ